HFNGKSFSGRVFGMDEVNHLFSRILKYEEDHGYPFASVHLDSVRSTQNTISGKIFLEAGTFVTIDSLRISGSLHLSNSFIENYLSLYMHSPYNQQAIERSTLLFKSLPYLQVTHDPKAETFKDEATVVFFLDKKPANQFDLVIGFLQNNVS